MSGPGRAEGAREAGYGRRMTPIRLLLVDDDPLVRAGLSFMLGGADDIEIVGEAGDGSEVAALVAEVRPDVVLMDIRMPTMDGLAATEALRKRPDAPEVVVLTTFHADEQVLRALRAGAAGFVLKDTVPAEIVAAVRAVAAGEPVLSPSVTQQLISQVAGGGPELDRRRRALDRLPEMFHDHMENVSVVIAEEPERELLQSMGMDPDDPEDFAAIIKYVRSSSNAATQLPPGIINDDQIKQLKVVLSRHSVGGKVMPYSDEFNSARDDSGHGTHTASTSGTPTICFAIASGEFGHVESECG